MWSLLTGYTGTFNRYHHRVGHLVQNRYKVIVAEKGPSLLGLVRYLYLNSPSCLAQAREGVTSLWCRLAGQAGRS